MMTLERKKVLEELINQGIADYTAALSPNFTIKDAINKNMENGLCYYIDSLRVFKEKDKNYLIDTINFYIRILNETRYIDNKRGYITYRPCGLINSKWPYKVRLIVLKQMLTKLLNEEI